MNCTACGAALDPSLKFCDQCGTPVGQPQAAARQAPADVLFAVQAQPGPSASAQSSTAAAPPATAATDRPRLPNSPVVLCYGENLLREYRAVRLRSTRQGEGTLFVTDARVVFYARAQGRGTQRASAIVQQTKLEDITGLAAFVSRRISPVLLVLIAVFGLSTLLSLYHVSQHWAWTIISLLVTAACILAVAMGGAERGRAGVIINSLATQKSPISFGDFNSYRNPIEILAALLNSLLPDFLRAHTAFDVLVGRPGADSDRLIGEIGALILDLQTRGEYSTEHWGLAADQVPAQRRSATVSPASPSA
jgi:hypothetical protein